MLKNRLLHTSLSINPTTHTALHNTHRSRVLGIYTWSFHALLLIRHINFTQKFISILKFVWDTWNRSQQYYFHKNRNIIMNSYICIENVNDWIYINFIETLFCGKRNLIATWSIMHVTKCKWYIGHNMIIIIFIL